MAGGAGERLAWDAIDPDVRVAVAAQLGAPVVETAVGPGGYSPGFAARCRLADGRRLFVKASGVDHSPHATRALRRELEVAGALPVSVPAPAVRGHIDDGRWVVAWFDHVDATSPTLPWRDADLRRAAAAIRTLPGTWPDPTGLPPAADRLGAVFGGFGRLAGGPTAGLDPELATRLDDLADLEAGWPEAVAGPDLLHGDLRADNLLFVDGTDRLGFAVPPGGVVFVDWSFGCIGAGWVDVVSWLTTVGVAGPDPASVAHDLALLDGVDADALDTVLAALAGAHLWVSRQAAPDGLAGLRAFQSAAGDVALTWLRSRRR